MKRLQSYEEFHNNQVQEGIKDYLLGGLATIGTMTGSPQKAMGQEKKPTDIVQQVQTSKDILGRPLTSAPSTKTETIKPQVYLVTKEIINPTAKQDAELKSKGYKVVWTDTSTSTPKWGVETPQRKSPTVLKSDNDKFFELGGYRLTPEVKEKIASQVQQLGGVDSVTIEASTDKTRILPRLKADLESKGYSGDNKGLSKARSNSIKAYLVTLGVDETHIMEVNLADQGKEGGYDPSARYVKLTLVEKGGESSTGTEYFKTDKVVKVYYQRISDVKQKKLKQEYGTPIDCEGGVCPTYN